MPEDDRFSKCMPKGYKGAYLHARAGHSEISVARALGLGISRHMKEGGFVLDALAPMLRSLEQSLSDLDSRRGELFHPTDDVRGNFHQTLERIALQYNLGTSTQILREVTQHTFERLHAVHNLDKAQVLTAFCEKLTCTLSAHWCFAVPVDGVTARANIMRVNQWDAGEQKGFEDRICRKVFSVVENLVKQALRSPDGKPKRTPPLPKRLPRFALTEMDQPLAEADVP